MFTASPLQNPFPGREGSGRMRPRSTRRWARLGAAAFLAWLAVFGVAPSTARAGCGHGVVSLTDPLAATAHLELLTEPMADTSPLAPSERPRPCTGTMCSGRPALPTVPA